MNHLILFAAVTVFSFYAAAVFLLLARRILELVRLVPSLQRGRTAQCLEFAMYFVLLLLIAAGGYGLWVEPYRLRVQMIKIPTAKMRPWSGPVRIVFFSDTHSDEQPRLEEILPDKVAELRPHAIIFGGDAVNSNSGAPVFRRMMVRLSGIAPVYAVRGNWEQWWYRHVNLYGGTQVHLLGSDVQRVAANNAEIYLTGFHVPAKAAHSGRRDQHEKTQRLAAAMPEGKFKIFVHHYPETAAFALSAGADLALSGDTHGGQVRLPFIGALVRISRFGYYFERGMHAVEGAMLYVSSGVGMEGGMIPRVRIFCPPEIVLLEIMPEEKQAKAGG